MDVQGVLQLLTEGLDLSTLQQQLSAQAVNLTLQHVDVCHGALEDGQFTVEVCKLDAEDSNLVQTVSVLGLAP